MQFSHQNTVEYPLEIRNLRRKWILSLIYQLVEVWKTFSARPIYLVDHLKFLYYVMVSLVESILYLIHVELQKNESSQNSALCISKLLSDWSSLNLIPFISWFRIIRIEKRRCRTIACRSCVVKKFSSSCRPS